MLVAYCRLKKEEIKISKPSETLATEQNSLSQREKEKVIDGLHIVEESNGT